MNSYHFVTIIVHSLSPVGRPEKEASKDVHEEIREANTKSWNVFFIRADWITIILIVAVSQVFAQDTEGELSPISKYFQIVRNSRTIDLGSMSTTLPLQRLKRFAGTYYDARESDPLKFSSRLDANDYAVLFNRLLLGAVKKRLAPLDYALVASPYLLRIKVVSVVSVNVDVDSTLPGLRVRGTVVTGVLEQAFQPVGRLSVGDTVKFYYSDFWRPWWLKFQSGCPYFVPLMPFAGVKSVPFTVMSLDGMTSDVGVYSESNKASYGRYPIVNDSLIDRNDFFGYGQEVSWERFRRAVLHHITLMRSW